MKNLCKCGCGKRVSKLGNRYILGHNCRGKHYGVGIPKSEEHIRKLSESHKGKHPSERTKRKMRKNRKGMQGKHHSEETKEKIRKSLEGHHLSKRAKKKVSKAQKQLWGNPKHRKKMLKAQKGIPKSEEHKRKDRIAIQKLWQTPEYREKTLKAIFAGWKITPNKPEKRLRNNLNKLFPNEYEFVGDGSVIIEGKCPDFINVNNQKKVIELFGDYWHSKERTGRTKKQEENQRMKHFVKYGYKILIVWESELKNIKQLKRKLVEFHNE